MNSRPVATSPWMQDLWMPSRSTFGSYPMGAGTSFPRTLLLQRPADLRVTGVGAVSIDLRAIDKAFHDANSAAAEWFLARTVALANHSGYVTALKLWKVAHDKMYAARKTVDDLIVQLSYDPLTDRSWYSTLQKYSDVATKALVALNSAKAELLADMAAHVQLIPAGAPSFQAPAAALVPGAVTVQPPAAALAPGKVAVQPDGSVLVTDGKGTAVAQRPAGGLTVSDATGSVDVTPAGDVVSKPSIPLWAWLGGAALVVYGLARFVL